MNEFTRASPLMRLAFLVQRSSPMTYGCARATATPAGRRMLAVLECARVRPRRRYELGIMHSSTAQPSRKRAVRRSRQEGGHGQGLWPFYFGVADLILQNT
jgi:hypothetical protein